MHAYIGLMSGTSLDGIDGVLVRFDPLQVLSHAHRPLPEDLRRELLALNTPGGVDELHRAAQAGLRLFQLYAHTVEQLLQQAGLPPEAVRAVGAHGQTVRHQPQPLPDGTPGYTLQLHEGALLAERTGIDVVCDFRSRDVAAGGQGAPLVPAFHAEVFGSSGQALAVLNLGGIANLSLLREDGSLIGFDCGAGNALMDGWVARHLQRPFDEDGGWAASGQVSAALLDRLLSEPYLQQPPPKSTGRDLFHEAWLQGHLNAQPVAEAADVQATLAEFTARCAADALQRHAPTARRLLVCGGGALNGHLMRRLSSLLPAWQVDDTRKAGLPPQQVEAAAFAWLARAFVDGRPGNRPEVTGAAGPRRLGALYPGR